MGTVHHLIISVKKLYVPENKAETKRTLFLREVGRCSYSGLEGQLRDSIKDTCQNTRKRGQDNHRWINW